MRRIREESIITTTNDEKRLKKILDMIEIANDMTKYIEVNCKSKRLRDTFKEYYKSFRAEYIKLFNEINEVDIKNKAKVIIENNVCRE
ncbi:hypothetical protein [Clostridium gelidum]|nr:hypothetical protein [Clostridium gelidum]